MTLTSEPIIFSSEVIDNLPLYYRAMALYLANVGRAIIKKPSEIVDVPT